MVQIDFQPINESYLTVRQIPLPFVTIQNLCKPCRKIKQFSSGGSGSTNDSIGSGGGSSHKQCMWHVGCKNK